MVNLDITPKKKEHFKNILKLLSDFWEMDLDKEIILEGLINDLKILDEKEASRSTYLAYLSTIYMVSEESRDFLSDYLALFEELSEGHNQATT